MNKEYYIDKAKAFLQSLKPKVYVCCIDEDDVMYYLRDDNNFYLEFEDAKTFYCPNEARTILDSIIKNEKDKYFILTE